MYDIDYMLNKLSKSKFRSGFHLNKKMKDYVNDKGINTIRKHAYDFVNKRLKSGNLLNDGKQTPMKQVHPVFVAQHACACCCRSCLEKWHNINKGRELTDNEIDYIVNLLIKWIEKEYI